MIRSCSGQMKHAQTCTCICCMCVCANAKFTCWLQNLMAAQVVDLQENRRSRFGYAQQTCLRCTFASSITSNRKVIDYEEGAERGRIGQAPTRMQTDHDMLILPTCDNTQQTAKQHSWTLSRLCIHRWTILANIYSFIDVHIFILFSNCTDDLHTSRCFAYNRFA